MYKSMLKPSTHVYCTYLIFMLKPITTIDQTNIDGLDLILFFTS